MKDPTKPEAAAPVSLLRVEERIERVPITPEQAQERMLAAAGIILEAQAFDQQLADLKEEAKTVKARAEAKHEEADRIVLDARSGTAAAPYPVIVERHPTHAAEMIVWRVPDGVLAGDILDLEEEGDARIGAREAQGCMLIETRAMNADELEELRRFNTPPLPFDTSARPAAITDEAPGAADAGGAAGAGDDGEDAGDEGAGDDGDKPEPADDLGKARKTRSRKGGGAKRRR